jgi:hypothetical protein
MAITTGIEPVRELTDLTTDRWAGTPLAEDHWLESPSGFPPGGIGAAAPEPDLPVATVRGVQLTRGQLTEALAFTEFLAGHALSAQDRSALGEDLVDAFEDSPKHAARHLRGLAGGVRRIGSLDPIGRCQRRLQALTATYTIEQRRLSDGADPSPMMAVVGRYNPMVRHWASTGVVLVADALTARAAQHRLVLSLADREAEEPLALTRRLLDAAAGAGRTEIAELAASELRLLATRAWLRDMGDAALGRLREEVARAVASALDVDIVVQQVGFRAALSLAG